MSRRTGLLVTLSALLVLGAACAEPDHGVVYARWFYPESQWVELVCGSYGTNGACTVRIPVIRTDPPRWTLGLRYRDEDGEVQEGRRSVTELEYARCANGDEYPACATGNREGR